MPEAQAAFYYNSTYRHGVDEKRRLQIPAKWRPEQEGFHFTLILWPGPDGKPSHLLALPPGPMKRLADKLQEMPYADPKAESLRRFLARNADQIVTDKVGRFCLPETMAGGAGIEREAVFVGSWDRFEIWSPARYEAASRVDDALASEALRLI